MSALNEAYASNTETPLETFELIHSALTGGRLLYVRSPYDLTATLEDTSEVTFLKSAIEFSEPSRGTTDRQQLTLTVSNVDNFPWQQLKAVIDSSRTTAETLRIKYRQFLESDLSAPAGGVYELVVTAAATTRVFVKLTATYTPIPNVQYPSLRYDPAVYPGVKYA